MPLTRPARRPAAVLGLAAFGTLAVVAGAGPASAHVTVGADDPHQGASDSLLTFRVPDEKAAATTVAVTITFPKANPLASVRPAPKPGWTYTTSRVTFNPPISTDDGTITDGVSQVVYRAKSSADVIPVGGFDTFQVLVGPLPSKAASLAFPTVQTYSDGTSVSWIQPVTEGTPEPENPAPMLALLPAAPAGSAAPAISAAAAPAVSSAAVAGQTPPSASADDVRTARTLAVAGIVVGALGLVTGLAGVLRSRRRSDAVR